MGRKCGVRGPAAKFPDTLGISELCTLDQITDSSAQGLCRGGARAQCQCEGQGGGGVKFPEPNPTFLSPGVLGPISGS